MLPNFLVIGCEKCGTTSLCAMLDQHPEVFVTRPKEPHFFSCHYDRGWDWYASLFEPGRDAIARGEGSVSYASDEYEHAVAARLHHRLPDIRLIYLARDPIARIESSYRMLHDGGHRSGVHLPFSIGEAIEARPHLLKTTLYWQRINAYRRWFPDEQILVLFQEDLLDHPAATLARCFEFLGVDPAFHARVRQRQLNRGADKCYDPRLLRRLRTVPVWRKLPWRVRASLEARLRKPFTGPVVWEPEARRRVLAQLRPDALAFLRHYGKPDAFWSLEDEAPRRRVA